MLEAFEMTISWRSILTVLAVGLVILVGLQLVPVSFAQTGPDAQDDTVQQITVVGQGTVSAPPDLAHANLGVQVTAPTATAATQENNDKMSAITAKLKALGVAEADIQTSDFNISAQRSGSTNGPGEITGYQVTNTVIVTIRDLSQMGQILDQAVQAGANDVSNVSFGFSDPAELQLQALDQAVQDARNQADQLAMSSGVQRGGVLSISEVGSTNPRLAGIVPMVAELSSVPVQPGSSQIQAKVQVVYAIR
jgi:uncharacterized protein YggE